MIGSFLPASSTWLTILAKGARICGALSASLNEPAGQCNGLHWPVEPVVPLMYLQYNAIGGYLLADFRP